VDAEKLIEGGARALVMCFRSENKNRNEDTICEATRLFAIPARAVIAMTLKAIIAEDANVTRGDILLAAGEMSGAEMLTVRAVLNWRLSNLRALAEQVEKAND